jgi:hypothetical protein
MNILEIDPNYLPVIPVPLELTNPAAKPEPEPVPEKEVVVPDNDIYGHNIDTFA